MENKELFSMLTDDNQRPGDKNYYQDLGRFWDKSIGTNIDKLKSFTKFVPFTEFPKFICKYEIFKKILHIHGGIVECGVHQGAGLMTWALLSSIFEPVNHIRKIIGFDTFEGFADITEQDKVTNNAQAKVGGLAVNSFEDIKEAIRIYDMFRPLGHIGKVELVKGDASITIEKYIAENPHLVVSLLYLDFDVYAPTRRAIELLIPRMPKGAIIAFDELYIKQWPGETQALIDTIGISNLQIERFPFFPQISYAVLR